MSERVATDAQPTVSIKALPEAQDGTAAAIVAAALGSDPVAAAHDRIGVARRDAESDLYGLTVDGHLAAVYILRRINLMNEISCLAVGESFRRQGHGRACLYDALLRSGRRPLVVETDEDAVGFYKRCGFKLVGKRTQPDGTVRYRLGWHAPLPKPASE